MKPMTISAMIARLKEVEQEHGDITVRDANGNYMFAEESATYVGKDPDTGEPNLYFQCDHSIYG